MMSSNCNEPLKQGRRMSQQSAFSCGWLLEKQLVIRNWNIMQGTSQYKLTVMCSFNTCIFWDQLIAVFGIRSWTILGFWLSFVACCELFLELNICNGNIKRVASHSLKRPPRLQHTWAPGNLLNRGFNGLQVFCGRGEGPKSWWWSAVLNSALDCSLVTSERTIL